MDISNDLKSESAAVAKDDKQFLFYVYELSDPTDSKVFYVGEGQKNRVNAHGSDLDDQDGKDLCSGGAKNRKILEIRQKGHDVRRTIIGRYATKEQALAVEATLIKWVYGFDNLTNAIQGKHAATIRPIGVIDVIPGIDIERSSSSQNGEYTKNALKRLEGSQTQDLFLELKRCLIAANYLVRDFSRIGEGSFNPGIGTGQLSCIVTVDYIDCVLLVPVNVENTRIWIATTQLTREFSVELLAKVGATFWNTEIRGIARYMKLPEEWRIHAPIDTTNVVDAFRAIGERLDKIRQIASDQYDKKLSTY